MLAPGGSADSSGGGFFCGRSRGRRVRNRRAGRPLTGRAVGVVVARRHAGRPHRSRPAGGADANRPDRERERHRRQRGPPAGAGAAVTGHPSAAPPQRCRRVARCCRQVPRAARGRAGRAGERPRGHPRRPGPPAARGVRATVAADLRPLADRRRPDRPVRGDPARQPLARAHPGVPHGRADPAHPLRHLPPRRRGDRRRPLDGATRGNPAQLRRGEAFRRVRRPPPVGPADRGGGAFRGPPPTRGDRPAAGHLLPSRGAARTCQPCPARPADPAAQPLPRPPVAHQCTGGTPRPGCRCPLLRPRPVQVRQRQPRTRGRRRPAGRGGDPAARPRWTSRSPWVDTCTP